MVAKVWSILCTHTTHTSVQVVHKNCNIIDVTIVSTNGSKPTVSKTVDKFVILGMQNLK